MGILNFQTLLKFYIGLRNRHFLIIDVFCFAITPLFALNILLESWTFNVYQAPLILVTAIFVLVNVSIFYTGEFYRRDWRYAGIDELAQLGILTCIALFVQTFIFQALAHLKDSPLASLPDSLPLLDGIITLLLVGGIRFSIPLLDRLSQKSRTNTRAERILVMGAGQSGVALVEQMQRKPGLGLEPVAFVDDDPNKLNLRIRGLTVMGDRETIPSLVPSLQIDRVMIAMPTASGGVIREIVDICERIKVQTSTIPSIHQILNGRVSLNQVREISIEDLLRREPIQTDVDKISEFLLGKKVLISGAGGSIGSELCRQVLKCRPCEIVLLGHGENSVFNIQQELARVILELKGKTQGYVPLPHLTAYIADIRFPNRVEHIFENFRPDVVFHAAAHKHVPMMELNPPEAITNNIQGTKNLVELALKYDVQHFVMISTDKAVNPTNIMGCSKRVAEMLVLHAAQKSGRAFVVVRFGNVLGSRGSVVPTFKRQIAQGGPITITHPDICRYFMTIPEAVQLLLQAAVLGDQGQVFMLDMGQPVKILDLAKDLIRLSGFEVGKDIDIVFTGLRPGEKLFEELFVPGETYEKTRHDKILIVGNASRMIPEDIEEKVKLLCGAAQKNDSHLIVFYLEQLVHEYIPGYATAMIDNHLFSKASVLPTNFHDPATIELEKDLKLALKRQEFRLYYQPIIHLTNNQTIGFEALLRWEHPQRGLIPPSEFLRVAEDTGLIIPIGFWVIHEACRQLAVLQRQFPMNPPLTISVNLTKKQFFQPDLSQKIAQIIKENKLQHSCLKLEISESLITQDEAANGIFVNLKAQGFQLLIDNCGSNNSSVTDLYNLLRLKYGKFDSIKLDRSLISSLEKSPENLKTIQNLLGVAQELGMQMIVMGIETAGQMSLLPKIKCVYGQGNFFSQPLAGDATIKLVAAR